MSIKFKNYDSILIDYKSFHRNNFNKIIHFFATPVIFICFFGLLARLPVPYFLQIIPHFNFAILVALVSLIYFSLYGRKAVLIMIIFFSIIALGVFAVERFSPVNSVNLFLILIVLCAVSQLFGHFVEGRRPAFMNDLSTIPLSLILVFLPSVLSKQTTSIQTLK